MLGRGMNFQVVVCPTVFNSLQTHEVKFVTCIKMTRLLWHAVVVCLRCVCRFIYFTSILQKQIQATGIFKRTVTLRILFNTNRTFFEEHYIFIYTYLFICIYFFWGGGGSEVTTPPPHFPQKTAKKVLGNSYMYFCTHHPSITIL